MSTATAAPPICMEGGTCGPPVAAGTHPSKHPDHVKPGASTHRWTCQLTRVWCCWTLVSPATTRCMVRAAMWHLPCRPLLPASHHGPPPPQAPALSRPTRGAPARPDDLVTIRVAHVSHPRCARRGGRLPAGHASDAAGDHRRRAQLAAARRRGGPGRGLQLPFQREKGRCCAAVTLVVTGLCGRVGAGGSRGGVVVVIGCCGPRTLLARWCVVVADPATLTRLGGPGAASPPCSPSVSAVVRAGSWASPPSCCTPATAARAGSASPCPTSSPVRAACDACDARAPSHASVCWRFPRRRMPCRGGVPRPDTNGRRSQGAVAQVVVVPPPFSAWPCPPDAASCLSECRHAHLGQGTVG